MKNISIIILYLCSFSLTFGQNQSRIEYVSFANSGLKETQADTLKEIFKKVYYENNLIKKIEFIANISGKPKIQMVEYNLSNSENSKSIEEKYHADSLGVNFIFKKTQTIESFRIITTNTNTNLSAYKIPFPNHKISETTVYDNKNKPIAYVGNAINPSKNTLEKYKVLYNKKGISILVCDFNKKTYEVYSDNDNLNNNERKPIEIFNLNDFEKLKKKYFPTLDISYYQSFDLEPSKSFIKNYSAGKKPERLEFITEIGTAADKKNIKSLSKFSQIKYAGNKIKEIETHDNGLLKLEYFLASNENIENVSGKIKGKYSNYTLTLIENLNDGYHKETHLEYRNGILIDKNRMVRNANDNLICVEYYEQPEFSKINQSKTIKRYYDKNDNLIFESHYNNKGATKEILLFNPEDIIDLPMRFDSSEKRGRFIYFKNNYFPNEDIEYYKSSEL